jgi:sugar lactone lactonase YvrE
MEGLENFLKVHIEMGETPIWVEEENQLFWVDAVEGHIYKNINGETSWKKYTPDLQARALTRRKDGGWVIVTNGHGIAFWDEKTNACERITNPYEGDEDMDLNDGTVDRQGRFLVNSYRKSNFEVADGSIYRLDVDLTLHKIDSGLKVPNGMAFSPDGKKLYVAEMFNNAILEYDYNIGSGEAENRRIFAKIPSEKGLPDGLTVDSEGFIWTAHWGGWRVSRFDPAGKVDREIEVPSEIVTCIGFGGKEMNDLFITTAWTSLSEDQLNEQKQAGDLFRIKTNIKGIPEVKFKG